MDEKLEQVLARLGAVLDQALEDIRQEVAKELAALRANLSQPTEEELLPIACLKKRAGISRTQFYRLLASTDLEDQGIVVRLPGKGRGRVRIRWRAFQAWLVTRSTSGAETISNRSGTNDRAARAPHAGRPGRCARPSA